MPCRAWTDDPGPVAAATNIPPTDDPTTTALENGASPASDTQERQENEERPDNEERVTAENEERTTVENEERTPTRPAAFNGTNGHVSRHTRSHSGQRQRLGERITQLRAKRTADYSYRCGFVQNGSTHANTPQGSTWDDVQSAIHSMPAPPKAPATDDIPS